MRICLTLALVAGLSAADTPLATWSTPDGAKLREHFATSLYGKIWNDPAMDDLRAKAITAMDEQSEELGFKISEVIASFMSAEGHIDSFTRNDKEPVPLVGMQLDLGPMTSVVFDYWAALEDHPVEVAGADGAFLLDDDQLSPVIARFGTKIVGGNHPDQALAPYAIAPHASDWVMTVDGQRLYDQLSEVLDEDDKPQLEAMRPALKGYLGKVVYEGRLVEAGMWERMHATASCLWLTPVDRSQIDRFPANSMGMISVGVDGPELWNFVNTILTAVAEEEGQTVDELLAEANDNLASQDIPHTLPEVIAGLTGTWSFALTPSAPFPAGSLMVPRSPVIDDLVAAALAQMDVEPPADGDTVMLPIPNLPLPIVLARDARAWLLTSDSIFVNDWLAGTGGGFLASPAAQLASEKGGDGALIFGASDTANTFRTLTPFIALGIGQIGLDNEVKTAINNLLQRAIREAKTGYLIVKPEDEGITLEMQGVLTYSMNPAILAAIAIPNLIQSRVKANEAAAATSLRSGIFPAQVQFQSGGYADEDADGIGRYGFVQEMCSDANPANIELQLLAPTFNSELPEVNGYRYRVFLPAKDGTGTADVNEVDSDAAEKRFVAYAWPADDSKAHTVYALDQSGQVRSNFWFGEEPNWNDLFDGGTWEDESSWELFHR